MADISRIKSSQVLGEARLRPNAPTTTTWIYYLFLLFTVAPIFDISVFLGLSISAPLEFLLFFQLFLGKGQTIYRIPGFWITFLYFFWIGMSLSIFANFVLNSVAVTDDQFILLIRYIYWYIVFITIQQITSNRSFAKITTIVIGFSVIALAGVRIIEAFMLQGWSAYEADLLPSLLTKNLYGLQFSTFMFFAVVLPFLLKGKWRWIALLGVGIVVIAVLGNGSRGGWIGLIIGGSIFLLLYVLSRPSRRVWVLLIPPFAYICLVFIPLPGTLGNVVNYQVRTLFEADRDPSYAFRQSMVNKGLLMFSESPIIGAGLTKFIGTTVEDLPIPEVLQSRYSRIQRAFTTNSAHNAYILLLAETGLIGTIPYIVLMLYLGVKGFFAALKLAQHNEIWGIAVYCSFIAMNVHLWTLTGLSSTAPWMIYGFVAGMIQVASKLDVDLHTKLIDPVSRDQ